MDYNLDDWKVILATSALIICMVWDVTLNVAKDYIKVLRSSWIPRNLFVLNALTIQILGYIDIQVNVFDQSNEKDLKVFVDDQLGMDARRLTMCVFVGCLVPGMAMAGTEGSWSNLAALFVSLFFHIVTEIYVLLNGINSKVERGADPWFVSSGVILLLGASSILLLLGAGILSSKLLRDYVCRFMSKNLSEGKGELKSEVMKSWVAARVWKTWYFMLISALSPGAGMIVTICVAVMAAKLICRSSLLRHNNGGNLTFYLQCIFIILGWSLMLFRWFKTVLYCSTSIKKNIFVDIINALLVAAAVVVSPLCPRLACFFIKPEFKWRNFLISVYLLVPLLPLCILILATSLLWLFCFICWYFSVLVFCSEFVQNLCKLEDDSIFPHKEILEYSRSILEDEEKVRTFWMVNKKSFDRMQGSKDEDEKIVKSCKELVSIIKKHGLAQNQPLQRNQNSWMETISNLFSDIAEIGIGVDMTEALAAYREAQDVVKFVDCPENIVVDPLNIFGTVNFEGFEKSIYWEVEVSKTERKLKQGLGGTFREEMRGKVDDLHRHFSPPSNGRALNSYSAEELGDMVHTLVGNVFLSCLLEAGPVIVKHARQWAQHSDEKKIEKAVELERKVSVLLQQLPSQGYDI